MPGITDPAEAYFKDGLWGWDGSVWRKLPLLFGYSESLAQWIRETNATAVEDTLDLGAVPEGEIWVITSASAHDRDTNVTKIVIYQQTAEGAHPVVEHFPTAAGERAIFSGWLVLPKDDYLYGEYIGTVLNDNIYVSCTGFKMAIVE